MFPIRLTLAALLAGMLALAAGPAAVAQAPGDDEAFRITLIEALISAPPERALPILKKVMADSDSREVKKRALFVLGQIELPEAQALLVEIAKGDDRVLAIEAIRSIGIGGDRAAMAGLRDIYATGSPDIRKAVLEAWLIADDAESVFRIASTTEDPDEFERAVRVLGSMDATEQLRALRERSGLSKALIEAYAIAGDVETLAQLAGDDSDPERQVQAIRALGITGGDEVSVLLARIYRGSDSATVRKAALEGMLISGDDEVVLSLYRESSDPAEKRELLELMVMMDNSAVWDLIDETLGDRQ